MSEFVKNGNRIISKPSGFDYSLENGKVYDLLYDRFAEMSYLQENGSLNLPNKIYSTENEDNFINRIITSFNKTERNTTGVLLYGEKGTGKSICMKRIAEQSNLPIIVVNNEYPSWRLISFFKNFEQPVCVLFDELEKNANYWDTKKLLGFLDGIEKTCKKLVIFTCNDIDDLNENLFDRCSRIRYIREYSFKNNELIIKNILNDNDVNEEIQDYIFKNVKCLSVDNVYSIINEMKIFPDLSIEELLKYMNITESASGNKTDENNILDENHIFDAPF